MMRFPTVAALCGALLLCMAARGSYALVYGMGSCPRYQTSPTFNVETVSKMVQSGGLVPYLASGTIGERLHSCMYLKLLGGSKFSYTYRDAFNTQRTLAGRFDVVPSAFREPGYLRLEMGRLGVLGSDVTGNVRLYPVLIDDQKQVYISCTSYGLFHAEYAYTFMSPKALVTKDVAYIKNDLVNRGVPLAASMSAKDQTCFLYDAVMNVRTQHATRDEDDNDVVAVAAAEGEKEQAPTTILRNPIRDDVPADTGNGPHNAIIIEVPVTKTELRNPIRYDIPVSVSLIRNPIRDDVPGSVSPLRNPIRDDVPGSVSPLRNPIRDDVPGSVSPLRNPIRDDVPGSVSPLRNPIRDDVPADTGNEPHNTILNEVPVTKTELRNPIRDDILESVSPLRNPIRDDVPADTGNEPHNAILNEVPVTKTELRNPIRDDIPVSVSSLRNPIKDDVPGSVSPLRNPIRDDVPKEEVVNRNPIRDDVLVNSANGLRNPIRDDVKL